MGLVLSFVLGWLAGMLCAAWTVQYTRRRDARREIAQIDLALLNLSERGSAVYEGLHYDRSAIPRFLSLRATYERVLGR